ncbi:MAG TPA: hypothetical protein VJU79_02740, partial [Candidatus Dormibacteraeota bacterium]|nr:hypothetical protein [Candidatus Dormibacteraeota bacterium]
GQYGRFLAIEARYREAMPLLEEALRLSEQLEQHETYAQALVSRGIGLVREARFDEALMVLNHAITIATERGYAAAAIRAWNNLGVVYEALDRYGDVVTQLGGTALDYTRRKGDRPMELSFLVGILPARVALGDWDEALATVQEVRAAPELTTLTSMRAILADAVPIHVRRGDLDAAQELLDFSVVEGNFGPELMASRAATQGEYLRARGSLRQVLEAIEPALRLLPQLGLPHIAVKRALVQGIDAAIDLGDVSRADELMAIVREAAPGLVTPFLRAHAARLRARLARIRGEADAGDADIREAVEGFRQLRMPFEEAVALVELAEWLAEDRPDEAEELAGQARGRFESLGARPSMERSERVLQRDTRLAGAGGGA